jgi:hypothetical protein
MPKPNIFTESLTQDSFWVYDLGSCNILAETNNLVLFALISCLVSELQKLSSRDSSPGRFVGFVAFVSVISSSKKTMILAPFFYRA